MWFEQTELLALDAVDINLKTDDGYTAYDLAIDCSYTLIVQDILNYQIKQRGIDTFKAIQEGRGFFSKAKPAMIAADRPKKSKMAYKLSYV